MKSEVGCGIPGALQEKTKAEDERWMVNGEWAVVQYSKGGEEGEMDV
jgi:hypothetical protein